MDPHAGAIMHNQLGGSPATRVAGGRTGVTSDYSNLYYAGQGRVTEGRTWAMAKNGQKSYIGIRMAPKIAAGDHPLADPDEELPAETKSIAESIADDEGLSPLRNSPPRMSSFLNSRALGYIG